MALPKKGLRKIIVHDISYSWMAKYERDFPREDGMRITIAPTNNQNRLLSIFQRFHVEYKQKTNENGSISLHKLQQKNAVTNKLISQIIHAALKNGWDKAPEGIFHSDNYMHDLNMDVPSILNF